jgi:hypothetical protein
LKRLEDFHTVGGGWHDDWQADKGNLRAKKRAPLDVMALPDGRFLIQDGNATAQALMLAGWTQVPVMVQKGEARLEMSPGTPGDFNLQGQKPTDQQAYAARVLRRLLEMERSGQSLTPLQKTQKENAEKLLGQQFVFEGENLGRKPVGQHIISNGRLIGFDQDAPAELFDQKTTITGTRPPKAKAGASAMRSALYTHFDIPVVFGSEAKLEAALQRQAQGVILAMSPGSSDVDNLKGVPDSVSAMTPSSSDSSPKVTPAEIERWKSSAASLRRKVERLPLVSYEEGLRQLTLGRRSDSLNASTLTAKS